MKLSIVIPAHNEEHRLPPVLRSYAEYFEQEMGAGVEIILVANGSSDQTASVAFGIAEEFSCIKVIEETKRIGKGGAIVLGVKEALGEHIGFVDADGATAPEEFYRLYQKGLGKDGIIASRWMKGADVSTPQKGVRLLSSRLFNFLIRSLLGLKYKDTQCGAKIFKAKAWQKILPEIGTTRFAFDVDVLYQLKRKKYRVVEEPTVWKDVEGSKVQVFNTSVEMFFAVIRMRILFSPLNFVIGWYDRIFGRLVNFLLGDQLFRHTILLFSASMVVTLCNILFQMIVGRKLPQADFSLLATVLAVLAIINRPLATISTAINRYTSILVKDGREVAVGKLMRKWLLLTGGVSISLMIVCMIFAEQIAIFFHLDRVEPVVVSAIALPAIFITPVFVGLLHGLQRFISFSIYTIVGNLGRIALVYAFVVMLYPACGWALAGHTGSMYIFLGISLVALFPLMMKIGTDSGALPSLRFFMAQCFLLQLSIGFLTTGDLILVKHFIPEETEFAYAASLGRMVTLIAGAVGAAMFPKVASDHQFTREHRRVYLQALLYTVCFVSAALVFCMVCPGLMHRILYGITEPSSDLLSLTRRMGVVMTFATILGINFNLLLAQRRFKELLSVLICAVFFVLAVYFDHRSIYRVIFYEGLANLVALVLTTFGILGLGKREIKHNQAL